MKINILGTEYKFEPSEAREDMRLTYNDGYCDFYTKTIRHENNYNENRPDSIGDYNELKNQVKRHEIVHAFFFESGLANYADNEQLVEWIALQFPKMLKAFREVGAIGE
jgi:hypothetical protein